MWESCLEQILAVLPQVLSIGDIRIRHFGGVEERCLDRICFHQLKHACEE